MGSRKEQGGLGVKFRGFCATKSRGSHAQRWEQPPWQPPLPRRLFLRLCGWALHPGVPWETSCALFLTLSVFPCRKHNYYSCDGRKTPRTFPGHSSKVQGANLASLPSPCTSTTSYRHLLSFLLFLVGKPLPLIIQFASTFSPYHFVLCNNS